MKQAGRVRGGVKPSRGCETLETDRSRELESPAYYRGFLVPRTLEGPKAQEGTARSSTAMGGPKARWRPEVILCRRRNSASVAAVLRSGGALDRNTSRLHGAGWTQSGGRSQQGLAHPARARREGPTDTALRSRVRGAGGERNSMRGGRRDGDIGPAASGALNLRGAQR